MIWTLKKLLHPVPTGTFPLSARNEVDVLITEYCVFRFIDGKMYLKELVDEMSLEQLKESTTANFELPNNLRIVTREIYFQK